MEMITYFIHLTDIYSAYHMPGTGVEELESWGLGINKISLFPALCLQGKLLLNV